MPEHTASLGAKSKARSGLPEGFKPAHMPEALKPTGAVIPPSIGDQISEASKLKNFHEKHLHLS